LDTDEVAARLAGTDWTAGSASITREWTLTDFAAAIAFVNRVADAAQAVDHHPDIVVHSYNKVRLELSTHSAGGLTDADFRLAAEIDGLA
jgi:4a-hydroxytetrahydrobiopterin dehydratase